MQRDCYVPGLGRFCQSDPIGTVLFGNLAFKTLGRIGLAQPNLASSLYSAQPRYNHPYLYAEADPISFVDPEGLSAGVGVIGGAVGGGSRGAGLGIPGLVAGAAIGGAYGLVCMAANSDPCAYCYEADKRNMAFCHAMASTAGRRGTKAYANAYRVCIARANQALLECLEDCQKDLKNSGRD